MTPINDALLAQFKAVPTVRVNRWLRGYHLVAGAFLLGFAFGMIAMTAIGRLL